MFSRTLDSANKPGGLHWQHSRVTTRPMVWTKLKPWLMILPVLSPFRATFIARLLQFLLSYLVLSIFLVLLVFIFIVVIYSARSFCITPLPLPPLIRQWEPLQTRVSIPACSWANILLGQCRQRKRNISKSAVIWNSHWPFSNQAEKPSIFLQATIILADENVHVTDLYDSI